MFDIKRLRRELGQAKGLGKDLSQEELAHDLGLKTPTVRAWEATPTGKRLDELRKYASQYGVALVELMASDRADRADVDEPVAHSATAGGDQWQFLLADILNSGEKESIRIVKENLLYFANTVRKKKPADRRRRQG